MWERGLKRVSFVACRYVGMSLPMWERGLKRALFCPYLHKDKAVAPHVGAWIETIKVVHEIQNVRRSPCGSVD